jgi:hypothetical protein
MLHHKMHKVAVLEELGNTAHLEVIKLIVNAVVALKEAT